ncbi:MAG: Na+/H+ antiporter NhaA [Porphyromonadaceae bacterium]|nr:Na+/H+ antiporter NhaA [Porphyromonadaceae bacterium]
MKDRVSSLIDIVTQPLQKFMRQKQSGGIVLGLSVIAAIILANSPWQNEYFYLLDNKIGLQFNDVSLLKYSLHHWINDGLMAIFFFVVGLELKREIVAGDLSNPRKAILPIGAALGGLLIPAIIYISLNPTGEANSGWGIPMATDIAFALAVIHLLGKRVPLSLKVFLTALAIVDDLGAVLVIAFFYTSDISTQSLLIGLGFVFIMFIGNKMGVRSLLFYAVLGIVGVWIAFMLSGVHATIASVLAAFTIPADVSIKENTYIERIKNSISKFSNIQPNEYSTLTEQQVHLLYEVKKDTNFATPPLQRLEHTMHPLVTFVVLPIFALANAGISIDIDSQELFSTNVALGVGVGLLVGKLVGIVGFTLLMVKLKIASFPDGMNIKNLVGISLLASIGFTMSLFISSLAFTNEMLINQAKIGIFTASIIGGVLGYFVLRKSTKSQAVDSPE